MAFIVPNLFSITQGQQAGQDLVRSRVDTFQAELAAQAEVNRQALQLDFQNQVAQRRANGESATQALFSVGQNAINPFTSGQGFTQGTGITQLLAPAAATAAGQGNFGLANQLGAPTGAQFGGQGLTGLEAARSVLGLAGAEGLNNQFNNAAAQQGLALGQQQQVGIGDLLNSQQSVVAAQRIAQQRQQIQDLLAAARVNPGVAPAQTNQLDLFGGLGGAANPGATTALPAAPTQPGIAAQIDQRLRQPDPLSELRLRSIDAAINAAEERNNPGSFGNTPGIFGGRGATGGF